MASELRDLMNIIAASLWVKPCNTKELMERDFLKNKSSYGIYFCLKELEKEDGIRYLREKSVNDLDDATIKANKAYIKKYRPDLLE